MADFNIIEIKVCTVCIHLMCNGEYNDGTDAAEKCAAAQDLAWSGNQKYFVGGSTCEEDPCPWHDNPDECTQIDQGFSWSPCEGCEDTDGGDRFLAYVMIPKSEVR